MSFPLLTPVTPILKQDNLTVCYRKNWALYSNGGRLIGCVSGKQVPLQMDWELPPCSLTLEGAIITLLESDTFLSFDGSAIRVKKLVSDHFFSEDNSKVKIAQLLEEVDLARDSETKESLLKKALQLILMNKADQPLPLETLESLVEIHAQLAEAAFLTGKSAVAIYHNKKTLEYLELKSSVPSFEKVCFSLELGIIYSRLKSYRLAGQYLNAALNGARALNHTEMVIYSLNELGKITWNRTQNLSAKTFFLEALEKGENYLPEDEETKRSIAVLSYEAFTWIGKISINVKDFQNGVIYLHSALLLARKLFPENDPNRLKAEKSLVDVEDLYESQKKGDEPIIVNSHKIEDKQIIRLTFSHIVIKMLEVGSISIYYKEWNLLGQNNGQRVSIKLIPPLKFQYSYSSAKELLKRCSVTLNENHIVIQEDHNKILFLMTAAQQSAETAMMQGDFSKGVLHYENALKWGQYLKSAPMDQNLYFKLSLCYSETNKPIKAITTAEKALKMIQEKGGNDCPDVIGGINNLGMIHCNLGDYVKAKHYYDAAMKLTNRLTIIGTVHRTLVSFYTAETFEGMGTVFKKQEKYEEALKYYRSALMKVETLLPNSKLVQTLVNNIAITQSLLDIEQRFDDA